VTLLAVSIDAVGDRAKIPGFLKKHGLHCRVLLGDAEHLAGYDANVASTLYVVDRGGLLAGLPAEFLPDFGKKVEARLSDLLAGKPSPGRIVYEVENAPPRFGVLWRVPLQTTVSALALAPASNGRPAEIGLLGGSRLIRYSTRGELLGDAPLDAENAYYLEGADLDGDGTHEWIVGGSEGFNLVDSAGETYWRYPAMSDTLRVAGILDLAGDGNREILFQDSSMVAAKKPLPGNLWKTEPMGFIRTAVTSPSGTLLVQTAEGIQELDRKGRPVGALAPARRDGVLKGRMDREGGSVDLFGPAYGADVATPFNLVGDGKRNILVYEARAMTLFSQEGARGMILRFPSMLSEVRMAAGDLDGRPGDELLLVIPHYGLVALGASPEAKPFGGNTIAMGAGATSGNAPGSPGLDSGPTAGRSRP
jgi:hypothetical protein